MADEATLLALVQRQLQAERQLRTMVEEEAANAQERFEHEQVYQQHCQEEVGTAGFNGWRLHSTRAEQARLRRSARHWTHRSPAHFPLVVRRRFGAR